MKGVQAPRDSDVLVIGTEVQAAVALEKADHAYKLVIGCGVIVIAVEHVNRLPPLRDCSRNQIDGVQGQALQSSQTNERRRPVAPLGKRGGNFIAARSNQFASVWSIIFFEESRKIFCE